MAATTLLEELAQAAEDADLLAETMQSEHYRQRAARLRERELHVRELLNDPCGSVAEAIRWSTNNYEIYRGNNIGETLKRIAAALAGVIS